MFRKTSLLNVSDDQHFSTRCGWCSAHSRAPAFHHQTPEILFILSKCFCLFCGGHRPALRRDSSLERAWRGSSVCPLALDLFQRLALVLGKFKPSIKYHLTVSSGCRIEAE